MFAISRRWAMAATAWLAAAVSSGAPPVVSAQDVTCGGRLAVSSDVVASVGLSSIMQFLVDQQWIPARTQLEQADSASRPSLVNAQQVQASLIRRYPRELRDAGIGGTAVVRVLIASSGRVERALVVNGSGYDQIDTAAVGSTREMRFRAWNQNGCGTPIVADIPIVMAAR